MFQVKQSLAHPDIEQLLIGNLMNKLYCPRLKGLILDRVKLELCRSVNIKSAKIDNMKKIRGCNVHSVNIWIEVSLK